MSDKNQNQPNFQTTRGAYWVILSLVVLLAGILATIFIAKFETKRLQTSLIDRAQTIAAGMDIADLQRLKGNEADIATDDYKALKSALQKIHAVNPDSRFVYLMGIRDGKLFFYADSENPDSKDYSPPGQIYTEASQQKIINAREGKSFVEGPYTDRWGSWVSGYAALVDHQSGKILGSVGIDIGAKPWKEEIWYAQSLPAVVTMLILAILGLLFRSRKRQAKFVAVILEQGKRLKNLYEVTTRPELSLPEQIRAALKIGMVTLNSKLAIVSRIENDKFTILYCVTPPNTVKEGDVFELKETYCDITVKKNEVLSIDDMGKSEYKAHACYGKFHLESYIGIPVMVGGQLYGTLNFSSPDPHNPRFNESDEDFVRLLGRWVSATVDHELLAQKAQEVDRMKSEFVSLASHQLRTPLTGIRWFTDLLLRDKAGVLSSIQKDYIQQISDSNMRLIKLVNDLLNVSHIETGDKFNIEKNPVDVVKIIDSLSNDLIALAHEHQVTITKAVNFPKELVLNVDEQKIREVFQNLMSNAVKYSKTGGVIELGVAPSDDNNLITLYVKDSGLGIPKNQQSRMFEKFFRADNVQSQETTGTGLGMYIAKAITEKHGGKLTFESEENKGTNFFVSFPI